MAFLRAYMAGDPGLGSFLKKGLKKLGKIATGPIGTVASFAIPGGAFLKGGALLAKLGKVGKVAGLAKRFGPGIKGGIAALKGMSRTQLARLGVGAGAAAAVGGAVGYRAAGGGIGGEVALPGEMGELTFDPGTGTYRPGRRYRRMNVTNVRALRKAIRRVKGFAKIARTSLVLEKKVRIKKRSR